jgi:hypothetical protein
LEPPDVRRDDARGSRYTRSKLRKLRDTVMDVSKDVGTSVMSGVLVEVAPALIR